MLLGSWQPVMPTTSNAHVSGQFDRIVSNVRALLQEHKAARDSDNLLVALYWRVFDEIEVPVTAIHHATNADTIRRARQKIQNTLGQYTPSLQTRAARSRRQEAMRAHFEGI
jgi:Zn-dependent oligopeptidase